MSGLSLLAGVAGLVCAGCGADTLGAELDIFIITPLYQVYC
ncbi:MAG: hypothetical protein PUJ19_07420 [Campylobacteraceae bacterium]|nr:hypothetical protein [Campylobacteraceae bacterium]MDY4121732.1 hypothetical protein [Campylobacter sp.]